MYFRNSNLEIYFREEILEAFVLSTFTFHLRLFSEHFCTDRLTVVEIDMVVGRICLLMMVGE